MKNDIIAFINKHKFLLCTPVLIFLIIAALPPCWSIFMYITGTSENPKLEVLKLVGWGISGLIAIFGVVGIFKRAEALDKQNTNNKDAHDKQIEALNKQHKMIEKGHVHERFKTATEHLDNERVLVRIAAFNEFYDVAEIEPDLRKTILNILCTHLRLTTKHKDYKPKEISLDGEGIEFKPTEEVQDLLNVLFKPNNKDNFIFADLAADLEDANLQGANLRYAILKYAILSGANLQAADLDKANLQAAAMFDINLKWASLQGTYLQEAPLFNADLQQANLSRAHLEKATLQEADLKNANLREADLREADLQDTNLQYADLQYANLQYANLQGADLQRANLQHANLQGANLQYADLQHAKLQGADLQGTTLFNARINEETTMSPEWERDVKRNNAGETGVIKK